MRDGELSLLQEEAGKLRKVRGRRGGGGRQLHRRDGREGEDEDDVGEGDEHLVGEHLRSA